MKNLISYIKSHELLSAALILSAALLIFLCPAILTWRYFAPADIIRNMEPFINGIKPHNYLLSDVLLQFLPWFSLSKNLIWHGNFPLWNTYSGGGLPLFANMQSAILFPFSWFFYIFPMKLALLFYSFSKLFFIGFFTYLYLREIKCSKAISLGGALGFMFAGFNVVWLLWPHTNVVFLLPLGCFLIERYISSRNNLNLLLLAPALAFGIYAGHPETFFYISCFLGAYALFKIFSTDAGWSLKFKDLFKFVGSAVWGLLLAGALLLPFEEYLKHSGILISRSGQLNGYFLPKLAIILNAIPDFFGNPGLRHIYYANFTNYNESTMGYVGVALLAGALYSLIWHYRNRLVIFYGLFLLFCLAIIYHVKFIFDLVTKLPGFSTGANHRLLLLVAFCVVVLGCTGIEAAYNSAKPFKKISITLTILWLAVSILFLFNRSWSAGFVSPEKWKLVQLWQLGFYAIFVILLLVIGFLLTRPNSIKIKYFLVALIFLETGFHGLFFNTATKNQDFYPDNAAITFLQRNTASNHARVLFLQGSFPSNLGSWYGINQITDYDAIYLSEYQNFKSRIGNFTGSPEMITQVDNYAALQLLATDFIVSPSRIPLLPGQNVAYSDDRTFIIKQSALSRAFFVQAGSASELENLIQNFLKNQTSFSPKSAENYNLNKNGSSTFSINAPTNGYVLASENFYPGWVAEVDGRQETIQNVMGLKAIKISAGSHFIKLSYYPSSFYIGTIISLLSFLAWLLVFFWKRFKY